MGGWLRGSNSFWMWSPVIENEGVTAEMMHRRYYVRYGAIFH